MTMTLTTYSFILCGLSVVLGFCLFGSIHNICKAYKAYKSRKKHRCSIEWTTGTIYKVFEIKANSIGEALDKLIVKENLMSVKQWNIRKIDWQ